MKDSTPGARERRSIILVGVALALGIALVLVVTRTVGSSDASRDQAETRRSRPAPRAAFGASPAVEVEAADQTAGREMAPRSSEPRDLDVVENTTEPVQERLSFDVLNGPYDRKYLDALTLNDLQEARGQIRNAQLAAKRRFLDQVSEADRVLPYAEFLDLGLEGADEIYVAQPGTNPPLMVRVDQARFPELYDLRGRAQLVQQANAFREDLEMRRQRLLDQTLGLSFVEDIEATVSPDGSYFTLTGVVDGARIRVGQVGSPTFE